MDKLIKYHQAVHHFRYVFPCLKRERAGYTADEIVKDSLKVRKEDDFDISHLTPPKFCFRRVSILPLFQTHFPAIEPEGCAF